MMFVMTVFMLYMSVMYYMVMFITHNVMLVKCNLSQDADGSPKEEAIGKLFLLVLFRVLTFFFFFFFVFLKPRTHCTILKWSGQGVVSHTTRVSVLKLSVITWLWCSH